MSNRKPPKKQPMSAAQRAEAQAKLAAKAERRAERKEAERQAQEAAQRKRQTRGMVTILAGIVVIGLIIFGVMKLTGDDRPVVAPKNVDGYSVVVGEESAPTTLTIYEDLQCPACAGLEATFKSQIDAGIASGELKVEYRLVSFLDSMSRNDYSSRAANVLLAVVNSAGVDAFKTLHDQLYANQPPEGTAGPEDDELIKMAVAAGADEDAIREDVENGTFVPWLEQKATDQWSKDGHTGTPTVLVDGKKLDDNSTLGEHLPAVGEQPTEEPTDEPSEPASPTKPAQPKKSKK